MRTLALALLTLSLSSCGWFGVSGNGQVVDIEKDVLEFSEISISGAFDVHLRQADESEIFLRIDENLEEYIQVEVEGDRLKVRTKRPIRKAESLALYISVNDITEIDLNGAIELSGKGPIRFKNIDIECNGASEVDLTLFGSNLKFDGTGASEARFNGEVTRAKLEVNGSGEIDAPGLEIEDAEIEINGSGEATVFVTKKLDVEVNGSGDVKYYGEPAISQDINGSGSIQQKNKNQSENS
jgi:hypothetical protein